MVTAQNTNCCILEEMFHQLRIAGITDTKHQPFQRYSKTNLTTIVFSPRFFIKSPYVLRESRLLPPDIQSDPVIMNRGLKYGQIATMTPKRVILKCSQRKPLLSPGRLNRSSLQDIIHLYGAFRLT